MVISIDLDGCIADNSDGFKGIDYIGPPLPGALGALWELYNAGHELVLCTARCSAEGREKFGDTVEDCVEVIEKYLNDYKFPPIRVHTSGGKIAADYYIDDKAIWVAPLEEEDAWGNALKIINISDNEALVWDYGYCMICGAKAIDYYNDDDNYPFCGDKKCGEEINGYGDYTDQLDGV
jgi:hypothetical protein